MCDHGEFTYVCFVCPFRVKKENTVNERERGTELTEVAHKTHTHTHQSISLESVEEHEQG